MHVKLLTPAFSALIALSTPAFAADKYQVTGPVVEVTDSKIVVEKGKTKERHEFARDANTKVTGDLKVGATATVHYTMTASAVEVKESKAAEPKPAKGSAETKGAKKAAQ